MTDILVKSGSGSGPFKKSITNLAQGTKYYIRAYAQSDAGIGYGNELSFETVPIKVPLLTTYPVIFETQSTIKTICFSLFKWFVFSVSLTYGTMKLTKKIHFKCVLQVQNHSYRKDSTGFLAATLQLCQLTVSNAMI
jgi:hypothetical protein